MGDRKTDTLGCGDIVDARKLNAGAESNVLSYDGETGGTICWLDKNGEYHTASFSPPDVGAMMLVMTAREKNDKYENVPSATSGDNPMYGH